MVSMAFFYREMGKSIDLCLVFATFCFSLHSLFLSACMPQNFFMNFTPTILFVDIGINFGITKGGYNSIIGLVLGILVFTLKNILMYLNIKSQVAALERSMHSRSLSRRWHRYNYFFFV